MSKEDGLTNKAMDMIPMDSMTQLVDFKSATRPFPDQVALITGGGRGLGRAFAQALTAAGAKVAITARTQSQLNETVTLIEAAGGTAIAFTVDVTDRPAMEHVIREVEEKLGPIDRLVNNAAVLTPLGYDWEVDLDEWWRTMEINVRGPFLCTQLVLPHMMTRRRGRIVNISSVAAHEAFPYATTYCASKAALTQMTNWLAAAVKEHGISVFALAPFSPTDMLEILATSPNVPAEVNVAFRAALLEAASQTQASVQMLMFLASGQADQFTGRHISHSDSMDDLLLRSEEILRDDLYTLRLRV